MKAQTPKTVPDINDPGVDHPGRHPRHEEDVPPPPIRDPEPSPIQDEGHSEAAERYRKSAERFLSEGGVLSPVGEAAPRSAAELAELQKAEAIGRSKSRH